MMVGLAVMKGAECFSSRQLEEGHYTVSIRELFSKDRMGDTVAVGTESGQRNLDVS